MQFSVHQVSSANASATHLHVWGANAGNWNLAPGSRISGGGMAIDMAVQGPGVFGIVTTPVAGPPE